MPNEQRTTAEHDRLSEARDQGTPWRKWGPYLSERQWGTVREDYSPGGDAWDYFTHDQARSRSGTGRTTSSRSGSSASRTRRGTMART